MMDIHTATEQAYKNGFLMRRKENDMKHDNRCKLAMVIGRLEALHVLDGSSAIAYIIGASLEDLRYISRMSFSRMMTV